MDITESLKELKERKDKYRTDCCVCLESIDDINLTKCKTCRKGTCRSCIGKFNNPNNDLNLKCPMCMKQTLYNVNYNRFKKLDSMGSEIDRDFADLPQAIRNTIDEAVETYLNAMEAEEEQNEQQQQT